MKFTAKITLIILFCSSIAFSQELNREQKLQKIDELNAQIQSLESDFFMPSKQDLNLAQKENVSVFRIMPREVFDRRLLMQGGGSYYSFTTKSHDYQKIAQIGLEQNNLKVGFAGANYGFIADLGDTSLLNITRDTAEANFLINYKPPTNEPEVRSEQRKVWDYQTAGLTFKSRLPAIVGHSYLLRAISFNSADVLVALKIVKKDADGSLTVFWKLLENFEKPTFERNDQ